MKPVKAAVLLLPVLALTLMAQGASRELFERARMLEESNNKLAEAISLYTQVAADFKDRQLAATAQLRIGLIHERLGRKAEADRTFRSVIATFGDQADVVRLARERLPAPLPSEGHLTARRVWDNVGTPPLGTISPDGRYLSLTDWSDGSLSLREMTTGTLTKLTSGGLAQGSFAYGSIFAADGAAVAFNWTQSAAARPELRTVRLESRKELVVYRNDQLNYFQPVDWSQDGRQLLMLFSRLDGTNQIATVSVADGSARVLKTLDWRAPTTMAFSPDDRWIVYDFPSREQAPERDVFVLAADGSRETRIVDHPANDVVLGWAPDGRTVLFASDRTGSNGAWTIQVADGKAAAAPHLLRAHLPSRVLPLGFTRAGAFYYFSFATVSDVYTADVDLVAGRVANAPVPVAARFLGANESADWSPDGRSLAIVRQPPGLGDKHLLIHSPADGAVREIPLRISPANWPRWSADAASILVSGRNQKNRRGFFGVDARTGAVTELFVPQSAGAGVRTRAEWAADGKSFFYAGASDDCLCVIRRDLSTGAESIVYRTPPSSRMMTVAPSPDGAHVAVMWFDESRQRPTVTLVPLGSGQPRIVYDGEDLAWFNLLAWTPDSRSVLVGRYDTPERTKVGVWRVPSAGGEPASIGLAMAGLRDLRVRPDGRGVVFTAGLNKGDVWVMENFLGAAATTKPVARRQ